MSTPKLKRGEAYKREGRRREAASKPLTPSQEYTWQGRAISLQVGKPLFGPHKIFHDRAIVLKRHDSPSGIPLCKGYEIRFFSMDIRNRWLRSQGFRGKL